MLVILLLLISSAYIELTGHIEGTAQGDNLNFKIVIYYNNTRYLLANHIFFATNGTHSCYGYTDQRGLGNVTMGRPFFISVPSFVPSSYGKNDFATNSFYREVGLNFFNVTGICPGSRNSLDPYVELVRESDLQVLQEPWWVISTTPTFQYHLDKQVNSSSADFLALTVAVVSFIVLAVIRDPSILGWLDFSKFIYNVPYNPPSTEMTVNKGNIAQTEKGHSIIQDESDKRLTDENKLIVIGKLSDSLAQVANQVGPGLINLAYLIEESDKKTPKQDPEKPEQQESTAQRSEEAYQSYRQGERDSFEYNPGFVPGQDVVPDQTGQGPDRLETQEVAKELYRQGERESFVQESSKQSNQFSNPIAQFLYTLGHGFTIATLPFSYLSKLYNYLLDGLFADNRKVENDNQSTSSVSAGGLEVTQHQSKDIKQQILEKSDENFKQGIKIFLKQISDILVLNYIGINMNVIRNIDLNLKFFDNINNLDQNLNLHGISAVRKALQDPNARKELLEWLEQLRQSKSEQDKREIKKPNDSNLANLIDAIEQMKIEDLNKIIEAIQSIASNQSNSNDSMAHLVSSIWNVDKGLASLLIQIQEDPKKANNLKSQLEKLYIESYFNKDNMRLSEEERRTYTIIYNVLTTNMTMEEIHLVESINVLRKYELNRLFRQLEAEIDMGKEINAPDLQEKLEKALQSINDKYGLEIFTQDEINFHSKVINDIMLDPKIAKAFLKGLSIYYGSLGNIIDNKDSWVQKSNQILLLGIRNILDQKDIDENTKNQLIDISVKIMLNDEDSLKRIINTFGHSPLEKLIQKLENRAKLIELIRERDSKSLDIGNLDQLLEKIFDNSNLIPNHLPKNKEDYTLNYEELTELTKYLKSALDANLFTLSLSVVENKSLNIASLDKVLPKYLDEIPGLISERTPLGFFYNTQDSAFITKLNQSLVGNHFMGRIRGWTEIQQIQTVLTSFANELILSDYQIYIVDGIVHIKKGDETIQTLHLDNLDKPVENISEIRLLARNGQIYLQYGDQILPTEIKIDDNKINEKIQQMEFMTKDGKLYAVYGSKEIELKWEYIFTPIMHRFSLYVFNLNSKTANQFIQQLIQEMGNRKLSYEQFIDLLKQTGLKKYE